jgi:hypothetical protein
VEIINLSVSAASNAMIQLQVNQGLGLNPDAVIVLFSEPRRMDFAANHDQNGNGNQSSVSGIRPIDIINFNVTNYVSSSQSGLPTELKKLIAGIRLHQSDELEFVKQYFLIKSVLDHLSLKKINFCFSFGGFDHAPNRYLKSPFDLLKQGILEKHFLKNDLHQYQDRSISVSLWGGVRDFSKGPKFHTDDDDVQSAFSNQCINLLGFR